MADRTEPSVVRADQRQAATGLPAGVGGEQAFHLKGVWVGFLRLEPGAASGWHHHGEWDSYACVLSGVLRWEFGQDGSNANEVGAGDVGHMPAWIVHRDVSAGEEALDMILFRAGEGDLTIDVPGPDAAARPA
ncbi:MAG: cupin domain-containing protein [Chloroflexota bacterium]|nr:cupin domain-containing protein [Chloroflexota bacterium]